MALCRPYFLHLHNHYCSVGFVIIIHKLVYLLILSSQALLRASPLLSWEGSTRRTIILCGWTSILSYVVKQVHSILFKKVPHTLVLFCLHLCLCICFDCLFGLCSWIRSVASALIYSDAHWCMFLNIYKSMFACGANFTPWLHYCSSSRPPHPAAVTLKVRWMWSELSRSCSSHCSDSETSLTCHHFLKGQWISLDLIWPTQKLPCLMWLGSRQLSVLTLVAHLKIDCQRHKLGVHNNQKMANSAQKLFIPSCSPSHNTSNSTRLPLLFPPFPVMSQVRKSSLSLPSVSIFQIR